MRNKKDRGSTLLLSILILAGVMSISLAIGGLTVRELQTTSDLSRSNHSFYAADSGMERALYEYRKNAQTSGVYAETLSNDASYSVTLAKRQAITGSLHQDEVRQFDLVGNYIQKIALTWKTSNDQAYNTGSIAPSMQYKLISFPTESFEEKDVTVKEGLCDPACGNAGWEIPVDTSNPGKDHILRIKPISNGADYEISVTGTGTGNLEVVTVTSDGSFASTKRGLEAELQPGKATTGAWDYVLYSGNDLSF